MGAFRDALANDPAVLSARFENAATLEGVPVARASLLPSVSLGYSTNKNTGEVERPGVPSSPTEYTSRQFSLSVRQPLYNREAYVRYRQSATKPNFRIPSCKKASTTSHCACLRLISKHC